MTIPPCAGGRRPTGGPRAGRRSGQASHETRTHTALGANQPTGSLDRLADQILGIADRLTQILDQAATRSLAIPPSISNSVHDLRGWAYRIGQGTAARPAAVDATRLLAYLRGLPDQQLLALLADLPWARLDTLLDAVNTTPFPPRPPSPQS
jgi:hypothetical protein